MNKKLEESELKELFEIIKEYQDIFDEISKVENELKRLNQLQDKLVKSLELNRNREKIFTESIIKKYGIGRFNPETLEYELKENHG